jgi:enoyl-[acyl-carrier protein] reductase II
MALRTRLCGLLGIEVPVIQAGMSIYTSAELAAAVSNAGGLGSLGVWQRSLDDLEHSLRTLNALTDRPFALNHVVPDLDEEAFDGCLRASPAVMAFALDDAGRSLVERVHDAGGLAMQQLSTVAQAERAADNGVDLIVAQGSESGGFAGVEVSTLALLPQVVDAVAPVPVIAAGGIGDGRGVAAALVLGAAGVNLGTRFLATRESAVSEVFRRHIVQSASGDWQQVEWQKRGPTESWNGGLRHQAPAARQRLLPTVRGAVSIGNPGRGTGSDGSAPCGDGGTPRRALRLRWPERRARSRRPVGG